MDGSRKVLQEFSSGLRGIGEAHRVSDSAADGLSVLDDIVVAWNSLCPDVLDIENTGCATITRRTTVETTAVEAILKAIDAVGNSLWKVTHLEPVADWSADGPATVSAFDTWSSKGLIGVPDIHAATYVAGPPAATAAGQEFVGATHLRSRCHSQLLVIKYYVQLISALNISPWKKPRLPPTPLIIHIFIIYLSPNQIYSHPTPSTLLHLFPSNLLRRPSYSSSMLLITFTYSLNYLFFYYLRPPLAEPYSTILKTSTIFTNNCFRASMLWCTPLSYNLSLAL